MKCLKTMISCAAMALSCGAFAGEVNLRTVAVTDGSGSLAALSDGSAVWAAGREADKAFDGSVAGNDFYDPKSAARDTWTGFEVSTPRILTRIRYYGRESAEMALRHLRASVIQGANSADFSDAVSLHEFTPPKNYAGGAWVEEFVVPATQAFRFFRILERYSVMQANTFAGFLRELELYGVETATEAAEVEAAAATGVAAVAPTDCAMTTQGFTNDFPVFSATVARPYTEIVLLRAPGAGGPWTEVASCANDSLKVADTTAAIGVPGYYRVAAAYTDSQGVRTVGGAGETMFYHRRVHLLERDWSDMTHVKDGVEIIYRAGASHWSGTSVADSIRRAFDDAIGKYGEGPNVASGSPHTCIGVDFGSDPCYVTSMRLNFQYDNDTARLTGVVLAGSNETEWYNDDNFTQLTEPLVYSKVGWYAPSCITTNTPYRYVFCLNTQNNGWAAQAAELQLFGWPASATASAAVGVRDVAVARGTSPTLALSWSGDLCTTCTYDVERRADGGEWQTVASGLAAGTTAWTDSAAPYDGTHYAYRVVSRSGEAVAYSATAEARPYSLGNGTGLHGEWWTNFVTTAGGEDLALITTNAALDFASAEIGGETANLFARWSGRLIAPYAGEYAFEAETGGTVALWIDGSPVLCRNTARANAITLTAGEHELTATWFKGSAADSFRLFWGGCVAREAIPSTQLVPEPPRALPEGWMGARTFGAPAGSCYSANVFVGADGALDFAYGGPDLSYSNNGYSFMWQPVKGDFTLSAKVESLAWDNSWWGPKAGLMVRSSLDASAMMRVYGMKRSGGYLYLVGRHKSAETGSYILEQNMIDGKAGSTISYAPAPTWFRLQRTGNVFTFFYRRSAGAAWIKLYEHEDTAGEYGEITYVGPAAFGESAGAGDLAVPYRRWRFSDVRLCTPKGTAVCIR